MPHTFSPRQKEELILKIQEYFLTELDRELGIFETEFLLDFLNEQFGPYYYNQAVRDVQTHLSGFIDNVNERIDELELPLPVSKSVSSHKDGVDDIPSGRPG